MFLEVNPLQRYDDQRMRLKIYSLIFAFTVVFAVLIIRLFYWQVVKGSELSQTAVNQYKTSEVMTAPRGNIIASDGSYWALRADAWLVYANPSQIKDDPKLIAEKLAPYFVDDSNDHQKLLDEIDRLTSLISKKNSFWVPLKNRVSSSIKNEIEKNNFYGIGFQNEETRFYPEASSAAQVLGFVGKGDNGEDVGYFGLEGYYNLSLSGKPGFYSGEKDALGKPILLGSRNQVSPISGVNLITTLDKRIQFILETKLKEGIEKYGARGGSVIVMNPDTGSILGMASYPSFDPSKYWEYSDSVFKNTVISDAYEPGSIFKPIVMAAGIDAGKVKPETKCDICGGPLKVDKYYIETWNKEYHPDATMTDVIIHSDNVGMSFVGQKLGEDALYDYLDKFGIGKMTGIDLQGEVAPKLRQKGTWNVVDLATASFGQGVAVTSIQMIRAIAAIANGGYLVTPHVVSKIQGDGWSEDVKNLTKTRIISEEAANDVALMMAAAAQEGESKWAYIPGFRVAGKTGTAQIPISGHYDDQNTIASFVGFAPYEKPKFIMLVTLREPQTSPWASETAAPLWYSIAGELFTYLGIQPR